MSIEAEKIRNMFAMVEDMKVLHAKCCDTYNNTDDEENKRWALYTGTCIQSLLDGNHIDELFGKITVKIAGTNIDVVLDNNMAIGEARMEKKDD